MYRQTPKQSWILYELESCGHAIQKKSPCNFASMDSSDKYETDRCRTAGGCRTPRTRRKPPPTKPRQSQTPDAAWPPSFQRMNYPPVASNWPSFPPYPPYL